MDRATSSSGDLSIENNWNNFHCCFRYVIARKASHFLGFKMDTAQNNESKHLNCLVHCRHCVPDLPGCPVLRTLQYAHPVQQAQCWLPEGIAGSQRFMDLFPGLDCATSDRLEQLRGRRCGYKLFGTLVLGVSRVHILYHLSLHILLGHPCDGHDVLLWSPPLRC